MEVHKMGKVQIIKKSRKEYKCGKCGRVIPVGSKYYKGEINFGPTIIRCSDCRLEGWEVTTSDYQLSVGEIAYRWEENYDVSDESIAEDIASALQEIYDETESRLENMPESLQGSDTGQLLQERMDNLELVIGELESVDLDDVKSEVLEECSDEFGDLDEDTTYDDIIGSDKVSGEVKEKLKEALQEKMTEIINEELSSLDV